MVGVRHIYEEIKQLANRFFRQLELLQHRFTLCNQAYDEFVVVTGADSTHYKSLCQLLSSLCIHEPKIKMIVFDLGLVEAERQHIKNNFPATEMRVFNYAQYPDYFNIKVNAGEYAWKPVIICDILNELQCCICWMDAGNIVTEPLVWIRNITRKIGMYSPLSSGVISDWTHPSTLKYLDAPKDLLNRYNLNAACISVCYKKNKVRELINRWKQCALIRDCIAPKGSSRTNHRQDQAVLSVIAHQSGITKKMPTKLFGFKTHQDID